MKQQVSSMKTKLDTSHSSLGYCWVSWSVDFTRVTSKNGQMCVKDVHAPILGVQDLYETRSHLGSRYRVNWSK